MKKILVTGATGCLGSSLLFTLSKNADYSIIAVGSSKERIPVIPNVRGITNNELFDLSALKVDVVVNCAFARGNNISNLIAALRFNEQLIQKFKEFDIGSIISISSQGIYKLRKPGDFVNEDAEIEPKEMYAMAKYAQERLFISNFGRRMTSIRLASLSVNARFLVFFVESIIGGRDITVTAPRQYVSIIDVRDAVRGIEAIMNLSPSWRAQIYNLGSGRQHSILDLAVIANEIGSKHGHNKVHIRVEDSGIESAVGMDCTRLRNDTGWEPVVSIESMVEELFLLRE